MHKEKARTWVALNACTCFSFVYMYSFHFSPYLSEEPRFPSDNIGLFKTTYSHDRFLIRKIINFVTMMINQSEQNLFNIIFFYNYSEIAISNAKLTKKKKQNKRSEKIYIDYIFLKVVVSNILDAFDENHFA